MAISAIALTFSAGAALAFNVGHSGTLYPVTEKSIKEIVMEKADTFDFEDFKEKKQAELRKKGEKYRLPDSVSGLPKATKSEMVRVDLIHRLDRDIVLPDGRVLYKKGMEINPLAILAKKGIFYPRKLVIINGERPEEIKWLKENFKNDFALNVLVTDGYPFKLRKELGRPVFNLRVDMAKKFKIESTPSVCFQPSGEEFFVTRTFVVEDDAVVKQAAAEKSYKAAEPEEVELPDFGNIEF